MAAGVTTLQPLRLRFSEGELTVSAQTPDVGEASETLPVPFQGEPLEIGFNARYLTDVVLQLRGADVQVELADDLSPCVLRGPAGEDAGYTAVVMPMRI